MTRRFLTLAFLAAAACGRQASPAANETSPAVAGNEIVSERRNAAAPAAQGKPEVSQKDAKPPKTSLPEPKGPIDPKSVEAAGQVVQHYGALIEQGKFAQAAQYWGNAAAADAFAKQLQARGLKHLEIGNLGEPEGAAGSIYVTMPVVFYDRSKRQPADVILRRVNDIPGSTDAQRRWHIERIDWKR